MAFPPLDVVQRWMQAVIQRPPNAARVGPAEHAVEDLITGSQRQTATERLAVYSHAYVARLLECLKSEFPAVRQAVGDDAFAGLAVGYLQACPPASYTLHKLGAGFADYLAATRPQPTGGDRSQPDFAEFLIELTILERTYAEVFDAAGPEDLPSLSVDELNVMTPDGFANAQLVFHETVRLAAMRFPCHEYASGVRSGVTPISPAAASTYLLIFRRDYVVRRLAISFQQYDLLSRLAEGATVSAAIRSIASATVNRSGLAAELRSWFAEWTTARLFQAIV